MGNKGFYAMFRTKKDLENYIEPRILSRVDVRRQMDADSWVIMLHDEFGFGPERCKRAIDKYLETDYEISKLVYDDHKDDDLFEYAKSKVDGKLKEALGEYFLPFKERYNVE